MSFWSVLVRLAARPDGRAEGSRRNGAPQFSWEAEFSEFADEPLVFRWLFNEEGQLVGAGMGPKSQARMDPEG